MCAALFVFMAWAGLGTQEPPLELEEVILLLQSGISEETITVYVRARGMAKPLSADEEQILRSSGATAKLFETLRELSPEVPAPSAPLPPALVSPTPADELPRAGGYQFRVATRAVRVPATVTDKKGRPVTDLRQEEFRLLEDGKSQPIVFFSSDRKPLRIGILLDVSGSMEEKIDAVADSLKHFLELLEPEDEIFVVAFSHGPEIVQGFTSDRRRLGNVLESLAPFGATALNDAVIEGLSLLDSTPAESKGLVIVTDGVDTSSRSTFEEALETARRANTPVYSIGLGNGSRGGIFGDTHGSFGRFEFDDRPLRELAKETGGQAEILKNFEHDHQKGVDRLKAACESIALALRHRYVLGYHPPEDVKKPGWRKIRVEVNRRSMKVRARKGYYFDEPDRVSSAYERTRSPTGEWP